MAFQKNTKLFKNGPLPINFYTGCYLTPDKREFALFKEESKKYIQWCKKLNIEVLGYDVWSPVKDGPKVVEKLAFEGDADSSLSEIESVSESDLVFNIWVEKSSLQPPDVDERIQKFALAGWHVVVPITKNSSEKYEINFENGSSSVRGDGSTEFLAKWDALTQMEELDKS